MDPITAKLMSAAAGGAAADRIYVDDVFSTFLYDGTSSAQTITNGIDLSGEGGMVWIKGRSNGTDGMIWDTERGARKYLRTNGDSAEATSGSGAGLIQFNSDGFGLGTNWNTENFSGYRYASWTFRKCPGFFDVVTYTGNGVNGRTISHNLGSVPGSIWIKRTDSTDNWLVYHRGMDSTAPEDYYMFLHSSDARGDLNYFADTAPTASVFSVQGYTEVNGSGNSYVAFIFAHDDQSFGDDGNEAIIKCDTYTGNGSTSNDINVGFEPQWLLIKRRNAAKDWMLFDSMRGIVNAENDAILEANNNNDEGDFSFNFVKLTPTGFSLQANNGDVNGNNDPYIYIAIRRPHKPPEAGTDVFNPDYGYGTDTSVIGYLGHPADMNIIHSGSNANNSFLRTRLTGGSYIYTSSGDALVSSATNFWDNMLGLALSGNTGSQDSNVIHYTFKRAPGFFDVVTYTGDANSNRSLSHNLNAVPEFMIGKRLSGPSKVWITYHKSFGYTKALELNTSTPQTDNVWAATPTSTSLTIDSNSAINTEDKDYFILLFATLPGISKVGSYTGTGSNIDVDCGFTAGARFILIKRTDSTGDWYVWDSEQGIVSGNDPYIRLNVGGTAAVTNTDYIDPLNAGFTVTSSAPAALNASSGTYIFLAIA